VGRAARLEVKACYDGSPAPSIFPGQVGIENADGPIDFTFFYVRGRVPLNQIPLGCDMAH
jgi:hypothetical protein